MSAATGNTSSFPTLHHLTASSFFSLPVVCCLSHKLLCNTAHYYAPLWTTIHHIALLFTTLHQFPPLCTPLHPFAPLCTPLHPFAPLCTPLHPFAPLCTCASHQLVARWQNTAHFEPPSLCPCIRGKINLQDLSIVCTCRRQYSSTALSSAGCCA